MTVALRGATAHAAQPETGRSPVRAMCEIILDLGNLPAGTDLGRDLAFATIVGASLSSGGGFGTAPADAEVRATLRSETDETMDRMVAHAESLAWRAARADGLELQIGYTDDFPATVNSPRAVEMVRRAAGSAPVKVLERPFRWSEDFGRIGSIADIALFGIGAGEHTADLHDSAYDFPDQLIPLAAAVCERIVRECLG